MKEISRAVVPNLFGLRDGFHGREFIPQTGEGKVGEDGLGMSHTQHIHCALYFSSNAAADVRGGTGPWPRGWAPLSRGTKNNLIVSTAQSEEKEAGGNVS